MTDPHYYYSYENDKGLLIEWNMEGSYYPGNYEEPPEYPTISELKVSVEGDDITDTLTVDQYAAFEEEIYYQLEDDDFNFHGDEDY